MNSRGNKANHSKESVLAHAKNLLKVLLPAMQKMPKIERIEGAAVEMRNAAFSMISDFTIAWNCPKVRVEYIQRMFGDYGRLMAAFELVILRGLLTDRDKIAIAEQIERIEDGISKWHQSMISRNTSGAETGQL